MTQPIPVILDGDPGHDDAIAWVLAKANPDKVRILGITTVSGNQTIEKTTYNALRIATLIGYDGPIAKGRALPLCSEAMAAPSVHGQSGLDGPVLPEPAVELSELRAVELMAKLIAESEEPVTIVSTGPLTNTASLILAHPELKEKIARISIMGGGITHGNWTAAAEFNILVDPEAAEVVFTSGIPVIMAGLDVTEKALVFPEDFERVRAQGNHVAEVVADWLEFFYVFHREKGYAGAPVHDPVAVCALVAPELLTTEDMHVEVETRGKYSRGATVGSSPVTPSEQVEAKPANAKVIMGIDREGYVQLIVDAVASYSEGSER